MQTTPIASRRHVTIFGSTNAGKSSLFNAITGQENVIVSKVPGTTTDPVVKAMELIPFGPIALVDTAGLDDESELGDERIKKTMAVLDRTDLALYVADVNDFDADLYGRMKDKFLKNKVPHLLVLSKSDMANEEQKASLDEYYPGALFTSVSDKKTIEVLKASIGQALEKIGLDEDSIIGGLVPAGSVVVLVVPVDSEAPKGRLVLPQVQLIRDCLDHGITCVVCRDTELAQTLEAQQQVDLVVTDSKVFGSVSKVVPEEIPLTSVSMLLANQKGDIKLFIEGAESIDKLQDGSKVLIAEACTHNKSHEDIGQVKIPKMLRQKTGKNLEFVFFSGHDFPADPADLEQYSLIVHCGSCMINKKSLTTRIAKATEANVPITNYGVLLAQLSGILQRTSTIFKS